MNNIEQVRTKDMTTTLILIDGSKLEYSFPAIRTILSELLTLSKYEGLLFGAVNEQDENENAIENAHDFVSVKNRGRDGRNNYRFRLIRLRYTDMGGKYSFTVILPGGLPISLEEAAELRDTLQEHVRSNGPGILVTPPEKNTDTEVETFREDEENEEEDEMDEDEDDDCVDFQAKEGATSDDCEDCIYYNECSFADEPTDFDDADDEFLGGGVDAYEELNNVPDPEVDSKNEKK